MIINWEKARSITGEDSELYRDLWGMILESMDEKLESIQESIDSGDLGKVEFSIHKLKGALRNVAAEEACEYLQALEESARAGDWGQVKIGVSGVSKVVNQVVSYYESENVKKRFTGR